MHAAVVKEPFVVSYEEMETPQIGPEEALIKVSYTGICGGDAHVFTGHMGNEYPRVPGHEFEGILVDYNTTRKMRAERGERVTAQIFYSCNECELCRNGRDNICAKITVLGNHLDGSFAEYVKVPAKKVFRVRDDLKEGWGALVEPLAVGVHAVRTGEVSFGESVVIIGGGVIGLNIALAAKLHGATRIIICELSKNRLALIRSFGFIAVDTSAGDEACLKEIYDLTDGSGADSVYEATGSEFGVRLMTEAVKPGGIIVEVGLSPKMIPIRLRAFTAREIDVRGVRIHSQKAFENALKIIESGQVDSYLERFITHIFPLKDIQKAYDCQLHDPDHFKILLKA